ncbi:ABC transporter substrate-binding protein [Kibdelosporangium persicum]|uniref:Maltose/maltodextrin ABC transporter, substrate binding periplasmic protein MalE n=1 Tax=Kibdelosporangium persicum TaxID=2698649 RepID=A0ABX2F1P3_9PSEU|nr:ABC transporter substrate-binding protein [Kibdelosporangium persicum]NRN65243.1 Maltose/maltodextrin ABC transporter, substrate binding periplasmic protein MalE [Kibdelosporangium persicum]
MAGSKTTGLRMAALACVGLLAVSCGSDSGGSGSPGGTNAAPALEGRGEITMVTGKDTSNNMQRLTDEWNAQHPNEKVRIVELPESADAQRQQLVQNAQVKSDSYTILNLDVVWTAEFAANRWVVELPRDEFDLENFLKPAVDTAEYRGRLYAVPVYSDGGLLYYRKDLLAKAGVQPPKTWDELTAACQKVKALPEAAAIGCYTGQFEKFEGLTVNFAEAVNSAGGTIVDESGKPTVDTPQARAGLDKLVRGFQSGVIPQKAITFKEEDGRRSFQAGELVFMRQWPYQWALANKTDGSSQVAGKFDVAPLPSDGAGPGVSSLGGHNFAISAFARNKATALDFIKYFTNDVSQRSNLLATSQAPTRTKLYDDPELGKQFPYLPILKQSILSAKPRPKAVRYGDVTTAIQEAAYAALTGAKDSGTALRELQVKLQDLLK